MDTRTLLEQRGDFLDGTDCSDVQHRGMSRSNAIGHYMPARQKGTATEEKKATAEV